MPDTRLHSLFPQSGFLIGMIHLPPLLGYPEYPGLQACIDKALADLNALQGAGFDAVLIENDHDTPQAEFSTPEQIVCLTLITKAVTAAARIPVGVQAMLNDWRSSIAIAKATGAVFTRLDVFVDDMMSRWGPIKPQTQEIMAFKEKLFPDMVLLTDVQVKYKTMLDASKPLAISAQQAQAAGSDGLVLTGAGNGLETPLEKLRNVRTACPDMPLIIGSGLHAGNIAEQFTLANGAIVGTSIKDEGGELIDPAKARALVAARNALR